MGSRNLGAPTGMTKLDSKARPSASLPPRRLSPPVIAQKKLGGVDAGIATGQTGIGNVFVAEGQGPGTFLADEDVGPQTAAAAKINSRSAEWNFGGAEQSAANDLNNRPPN